ncbi:uncharacterized protein TRAVEDRAFT_42407 [Trametes versicolor FP-101664 SS1]|uniref:uncharacterized protein n=1 Tax=Trametes versicolor (strain FP-101664) TaxID=717944 RepID=UPI00046233D7|nr:uncharacterized protein TRAVEDRAFT_42407 [Trametes versicolor FP-101664 SS1]EIW65009.1 hypothetical protein TRAVEDRAFT_42407 [Trametes versicolor FP-101664 SS1]
MSRRLSISSFFKSSKTSSKLSIDTSSAPPSPQSPVRSECDSPVSYVAIPGVSPTRRYPTFLSSSSQSSASDYAEEVDDDNLAWGKPKKNRRSRR